MKRFTGTLIAAVALVLVLSLSAAAGEGNKMDAKLEKLKVKLSLTDSQVSQLRTQWTALAPESERLAATKEQLHALKKATNPDKAAIDAKYTEYTAAKQALDEKYEAAYRSVLNADQMQKLAALRAEGEKTKTHAKN